MVPDESIRTHRAKTIGLQDERIPESPRDSICAQKPHSKGTSAAFVDHPHVHDKASGFPQYRHGLNVPEVPQCARRRVRPLRPELSITREVSRRVGQPDERFSVAATESPCRIENPALDCRIDRVLPRRRDSGKHGRNACLIAANDEDAVARLDTETAAMFELISAGNRRQERWRRACTARRHRDRIIRQECADRALNSKRSRSDIWLIYHERHERIGLRKPAKVHAGAVARSSSVGDLLPVGSDSDERRVPVLIGAAVACDKAGGEPVDRFQRDDLAVAQDVIPSREIVECRQHSAIAAQIP